MTRIGFVGLGNMGGPMAVNLVKADYQVVGFDLSESLMGEYVAKGLTAASSLAELAQQVDVVITMLPAGKHVVSVYSGEQGLLANLKAGALAVDCSTIDGESVQQVGDLAQAANIDFIDAPVSGGVAGAAAGTLAFMCGGTQEQFDRALPLLQVMGAKQFLAGGLGAGQVAKVCNNQLLAVLMAGTAEALNMGAKSGLDPAVLSEIMQNSSGNNWALQLYNPYPDVMPNAPASNQYKPGFMAQLMHKDLGLASSQADRAEAKTPMGDRARDLYNAMIEQGMGDQDFSAILKLIAE